MHKNISSNKKAKLRVAEMFYSLQGEGHSSGCPAVFLRLQHCNLLCGSNNASWQCDTLDVWRKGQALTFSAIIADWQTRGWLQHLQHGARLIVTGGEPLLQQQALTAFLRYLFAHYTHPLVEIETNATLMPTTALDACVAQYNCSPKGANSGNPPAQRHNPAAMQAFVNNAKAVFKFVVSTKADVEQIAREYLVPYDIPRTRVWLMPAAATYAALKANEQRVFSLCQTYRCNYSTRLQIQVWDQATGV